MSRFSAVLANLTSNATTFPSARSTMRSISWRPPRVQVPDVSLSPLDIHPHRKRDEGLEERSEECPVARNDRAGRVTLEEPLLRGTEELRCECRVSEVMLVRERELRDEVARGLPCRQVVEDEQPLKDVTVGLRGDLRRLVLLASRGGVAHLLERGRSRGRGRICRHPPPQERRVANLMAELGEVTVDDAVEVARDLGAQRAPTQVAEPREAGPQNLVGVALQPHLGPALDGSGRPAQKLREAYGWWSWLSSSSSSSSKMRR